MNTEKIIEQLTKNISKSEIINEPFVHKYVEDVFPKDFYLNLLANIPEKDDYTAINKTGTVSPNYNDERFIFNFLNESDFKKLNDNQKLFFDELKKILFSKNLFETVTSNFKITLDKRIKNLSEQEKVSFGFPNLKFNIRSALIKDFTKYSLGAHTDGIFKFITFLFYIPSHKDLKNNGTALYEPLKNISSEEHFSLEETKKFFKKIKTCSFIPNSVLIFPRTSKSFHGVEEINIFQKERNLLLLNYNLQQNIK